MKSGAFVTFLNLTGFWIAIVSLGHGGIFNFTEDHASCGGLEDGGDGDINRFAQIVSSLFDIECTMCLISINRCFSIHSLAASKSSVTCPSERDSIISGFPNEIPGSKRPGPSLKAVVRADLSR